MRAFGWDNVVRLADLTVLAGFPRPVVVRSLEQPKKIKETLRNPKPQAQAGELFSIHDPSHDEVIRDRFAIRQATSIVVASHVDVSRQED